MARHRCTAGRTGACPRSYCRADGKMLRLWPVIASELRSGGERWSRNPVQPLHGPQPLLECS